MKEWLRVILCVWWEEKKKPYDYWTVKIAKVKLFIEQEYILAGKKSNKEKKKVGPGLI